jgi:HK97 family phage portal protein
MFTPRDTTKDLNEANAKKIGDSLYRSNIQALLRGTYTDLLVYGDAYWFLTPSRLGVPYAYKRVAPASVSIVVDIETGEPTQYITRSVKGSETSFKPEEFMHFKIFDPNNDVYGLSPLESLTSTVAQDLFAQSYNESFFANNAQTGLIFNMKNASKEEVERNREFLKKDYVGTSNAHKPLILEGDVNVQRSVSSPADMQFIEGRRTLMTEILAVYDLPYTKLGGATESANRSQSSENDKSFRTETIIPIQGIVEEQINEHLIFLIFGIEDTLFAHQDVDYRDEAAQMEVYIQGIDKGLYTTNGIRAKLGDYSSWPYAGCKHRRGCRSHLGQQAEPTCAVWGWQPNASGCSRGW